MKEAGCAKGVGGDEVGDWWRAAGCCGDGWCGGETQRGCGVIGECAGG